MALREDSLGPVSEPAAPRDILSLRPKQRPGSDSHTPRDYLDYVVGDTALSASVKYDCVSTLGWGSSKCQAEAIDRLLGRRPPDLPSGLRTSLYVCPECGDIGCGATGAVITITDETVVWDDFAHESMVPEGLVTTRLGLGPLVFEKNAYVALLDQLAVRDEPPAKHESTRKPKPPLWRPAPEPESRAWPLWAALMLALGIAGIAYIFEASLLGVPERMEVVTVVGIHHGTPADEDHPATYVHVVKRADGSQARAVSRTIHQRGDTLIVSVVRGRLTGRVWMLDALHTPAKPTSEFE